MSHDYAAAAAALRCPARSRGGAITSTAFLSLPAGDATMGWGRYLADNPPCPALLLPDCPPRETSIDLPCLPPGITTPSGSPHKQRGAQRRNHFGQPRVPYSPAPIRVAVKVLSHGFFLCLETHAPFLAPPPHPHTATSYGGHGLLAAATPTGTSTHPATCPA